MYKIQTQVWIWKYTLLVMLVSLVKSDLLPKRYA